MSGALEEPVQQPGSEAAGRRRLIWPVFFAVVVALIVGLVVSLAVAGTTRRPQQSQLALIFVQPSAPIGQVEAIKLVASSIPGVTSCAFWSRERDYREALRLLPKSESVSLLPQTTPASWRCTYSRPATIAEISVRLSRVAGVYEVEEKMPVNP